MNNRKAQAQIITTVLIILLVLAAIVIVWQVISGTVNSGAGEIKTQSGCLGLTMEITSLVASIPDDPVTTGVDETTPGSVTIRPSKDIDGYRVFIGGDLDTTDTKDTETVTAASSDTANPTILNTGYEVEVLGKIDDTFCSIGATATVE